MPKDRLVLPAEVVMHGDDVGAGFVDEATGNVRGHIERACEDGLQKRCGQRSYWSAGRSRPGQ